MKIFIKKVIIYVVVIAFIVSMANSAYVKMNRSDSNYTDKFSEIPDKIQICNFGSSHGLFGYNYEDVSDEYSCFNFGLVSQYISYDDRIFKHYENHIDKGTIVFITVSYFTWFGRRETEDSGFVSKNKRYYYILPKNLIKEYNMKTDFLVHYMPVLGAELTSIVKVFLGKNADVNDKEWQRKASDIDVEADAQAAFSRHIENNEFDEVGNRIRNQEEIDALYDLIERCQSKGAIPILVTTPYLSEYTNEVKKDASFYSDFYSLIDEVVAETGVNYYDYAFDERFIDNYGWFINSDHLNKEGARNFVNILMEEVVYKNGYY